MKLVNVITTETEVLDKSFEGQTKGESDRNIKFVVSTGANDLSENIITLQHPEEHRSSNEDKVSGSRMCETKKEDHIRSFCYKVYGFPDQHHQKTQRPDVINV